jgi:hypothetical protein
MVWNWDRDGLPGKSLLHHDMATLLSHGYATLLRQNPANSATG